MTTAPTTSTFFFLLSSLNPHPPRSFFRHKPLFNNPSLLLRPPLRSPRHLTRADDDDGDGGGPDHYEMDEDEMEELDNKKDFDIEYDPLVPAAAAAAAASAADDNIAFVESKSFVSTQGWHSDTVISYKIRN